MVGPTTASNLVHCWNNDIHNTLQWQNLAAQFLLMNDGVKYHQSFKANLHNFLAFSNYYTGFKTTQVFPTICCYTSKLLPAHLKRGKCFLHFY
jgi:hypothetical protein